MYVRKQSAGVNGGRGYFLLNFSSNLMLFHVFQNGCDSAATIAGAIKETTATVSPA